MKSIIVDLDRCNGCFNCQIACKDEHCDNDWRPIAAPQHTANINMVVAISAITSFLFISKTVFISYYIVLWLQKYSFLLK